MEQHTKANDHENGKQESRTKIFTHQQQQSACNHTSQVQHQELLSNATTKHREEIEQHLKIYHDAKL